MAKEVFLYSGIYDYSAELTSKALTEASAGGQSAKLRINSGGGQVFAGYAIIAKMQELSKEGTPVDIMIDGIAASMSAALLPFGGTVTAVDTAMIMLHRMDGRVETEAEQKLLNDMNMKFREKLEAKIDPEALKKIKNVTMDDIFNPAARLDVFLTAAEAKKIKLVDKVVTLTPREYTAFNDILSRVAAEAGSAMQEPEQPNPTQIANSQKMDINKLKADHPEVYAAAFKAGQDFEADRVNACLVYMDADPKGVKEVIASGKPLTQAQIADFSLKAVMAKVVTGAQAENAQDVTTEQTSKEPPKTPEATKVANFIAAVTKNLAN